MVKFKTFSSYERNALEKDVAEWLESERPKSIVNSNLQATLRASDTETRLIYTLTIFYEESLSTKYMKMERRQENV